LAEHLAGHGYFVVSIQHELPSDSLLPTTGIVRETRRSNWERGVANIHFVLKEMERQHRELDFSHVALIGHSNGGDMSVLFAHTYPTLIEELITLDDRRMPLPRVRQPRISTLRSCDQPADEGVLPTPEERSAFDIHVVDLPGVKHNDMDDDATPEQRALIDSLVLDLLNAP
jgi:predicted dienelactone hydrolase